MALQHANILEGLQKQLPKEGTLIVTETHLCTTATSGFSTIPADSLFQLSELYALDARLEGTLKTLYERSRGRFKTFTFPAMYLHMTMDLWNKPLYLVDTQQKMQNYCYVTTITHIPQPGVDEVLIIRTVKPELDIAQSYSESDAQVVVGVSSASVNVSIEWFDAQYAGWRDRLSIAKALGLTHKEIAALVIDSPAKEPKPSPQNLVNIVFD